MTRRFEGAITGLEEAADSTRSPGTRRPSPPVSVEIAAAILILVTLARNRGWFDWRPPDGITVR